MKLIVCVLLLFALPHHSRAIGKCTGYFKETDPSNSGNGKQRPPAGTKCVEDCVLKSGRWGSSWCYTAEDKSQWGGECLDCSIFPDVPQCSWTDIEARDTAGDTCGWYNDNTKYCGAFDDDDFKSKEMCCGCKTSAAAPEIFSDDDFADYFAGNQGPGNQAKVSGGVIDLPNHLSGGAERVIETLLQETLKTHDVRFTQGVDAYWTLQIWVARKNRRSNFHSYAKNLPTGIQTIKVRLPTAWMGTTVLTWSKVAEKRVIVY